jgi:hypothetical protein
VASEERRAPLIELFGDRLHLHELGDRILSGVKRVLDPFAIAALVNSGGALLTALLFGTPFELSAFAVFQGVATGVSTLYGPVRRWVTGAPMKPDGLEGVPDSLVVSAFVQLLGNLASHYTLGTPVDPKIVASYFTVGTIVGVVYGPAKQALLDWLRPIERAQSH